MPGRETATVDEETATGNGPGAEPGLQTTRNCFEDLELLTGDPGPVVLERTRRQRQDTHIVIIYDEPNNIVQPVEHPWGDQ